MVFYIVANIAGGGISQLGLSGGDRILIEFVKKWAKMGHRIKIFVGKSGQIMYERYGIKKTKFILTSSFIVKKYSFIGILFFEILSLFKGCLAALRIKEPLERDIIIYSASDFWPDAIPAFIIKLKNKKAKWIAGFYLFIPRPFSKDSPYKGKNFLKGTLYYLSQKPIYWLIKRYADMVFVTSEPDVEKFITKKRGKEKIIVVRGGVDTKLPTQVPEPKEKKYDAVFIGRFHPQKGVLELINIWKYVVRKRQNAKLAVIGEGFLEKEIKNKIRQNNLGCNIDLLGFQDGIPKIKIFKQSKIVVHPAIYDSGGMAACEAMACGLPGVSFDLPALKTYYPKGMLKTKCFDLEEFSDNIIRLLTNQELYDKLSKEALKLVREEWDWDKRAGEVLKNVLQYR